LEHGLVQEQGLINWLKQGLLQEKGLIYWLEQGLVHEQGLINWLEQAADQISAERVVTHIATLRQTG
jgi:hypothetical protein